MKFFLSFSLIIVLSCSFAQTNLSSETKAQFSKIFNSNVPEMINSDWVTTHFPNLPIYQVYGEYCVSTVARVKPAFTKADLNGEMFVGSINGNVATIKIPLRLVKEHLNLKNVEFIQIAERIQPLNNKTTADVRTDSVWQGINLPSSYTGKNVLIGITDWGFDYEHPMFMDTTLTTSRVRAAWDHFRIVGDQPAGMGYGVELDTPLELTTAHSDTASPYYDYATHGSHVAGIAAGSGAGLKYRGVAFEAEYLFNSIQLDAGAAIDAFNWMKGIADTDGKRLVINMSWGLYYMGTMDGTSLVSQAINSLSDQGVVFVTSAGNNGNDNLHIKKVFNNDSIRSRIEFYGYNLHPQMWGECISMWGEPGKPFSAQIEVYNGSNALIGTSNVYNTLLNPGYHDTILVVGTDTIFYNYTVDAAHPQNSRPHIRMRVKNTNTGLKVVLNSFAPTGTVHYWNVVELSNGVGNWGLGFIAYGNNGVNGDTHYSLGEPACTEQAITVAAHVAEVTSQSGTQYPGSLAGFSSEGPTYDERIKPDVSAPGSNVISSINSYTTGTYTASATVNFNGRDYIFSSFSGTSMSSPATAGVAALILEANPGLTSQQVKNTLRNTARQDSKTGVISQPGSVEWGMGKVTATGAVYVALNTVNIETKTDAHFVTVYPNPTDASFSFSSSREEENLIQYQIFNIEGKMISAGNSYPNQPINCDKWESGMYFVLVIGEESRGMIKLIKQ